MRVLKVLAVLVLTGICLGGLLIYLTRIDFKYTPPAGTSEAVRIGEWIMDIPQSLAITEYQVSLTIGKDSLFLAESLEGPPAPLLDSARAINEKYSQGEKPPPELLANFDVSQDLNQEATLEAQLWPSQVEDRAPLLGLQIIIPHGGGWLALNKWFTPLSQDMSEEALNELINRQKVLFIDQVKKFLPHYRWLGSNTENKPNGFMTRYGLLTPTEGVNFSASVNLTYKGDSPELFDCFISAWPQRPDGRRRDPNPSLAEKVRLTFKYFSRMPTKFHSKPRMVAGRPGYENVIFTYSPDFDDLTTLFMGWDEDPAIDGSGTVKMELHWMADGFDRAKAPALFSLWRFMLDSAR